MADSIVYEVTRVMATRDFANALDERSRERVYSRNAVRAL